MGAIYVDSQLPDDERRKRLYAGDLFVHSPTKSSTELCALARALSEEAFAPYDPPVAQESMPAEEYAGILADLKPTFIHHPRAKELIRGIFDEVGCDVEKTYFDVPRLRTMAHGEYMKAGLALQFHAHRDTWFSAPYAQLNWWLPVYDVEPKNSMAFHQRYFDQPIKNSSSIYDYDEWNRTGRQEAAQLHSTVPNTTQRTRFSIDFRTVNLDDLVNGEAAPNVDSECTGTTLRDFVRATDLAPLDDDIVSRYEVPRKVASTIES
jgi:hypothetical protein